MKGPGRKIAWIATIVAMLGGCATMTGRTAGQYFDDAMLHARVKARLAAEQAGSFTRVNVNAYDGTVYLDGLVHDAEEKDRLERLAAADGRKVVSNLRVAGAPGRRMEPAYSTPPELEPSQTDPAASPAAGAGYHTVTGEVTGVDHARGKVSVKTADGTLDLQLPPSALADVKKGDRVSVDLGLRKER